MVKTALISVANKKGIIEFSKELTKLGVKIISTEGTAKILRKNKITCTSVSEYTKSDELLDGRVKTIHPNIHAGILAKKNNSKHLSQLKKRGILPIDLVVVNFYQFEELAGKNPSVSEAIGSIDIGGPSIARAAAKNFEHTLVLVEPKDYKEALGCIKSGKISHEFRKRLAVKAFAFTARYDSIINSFLAEKLGNELFPELLNLTFKKKIDLRYGENPYQKAAFYLDTFTYEDSIATSRQLSGKALSFNNILDIDNAFELVKSFKEPAATIVKHTNPSGCSVAEKIEHAFKNAYEADPLSAFGGVIALNRTCNQAIAKQIKDIFIEIIISPKFDKNALEILTKKKNLRIIQTGGIKISGKGFLLRKVSGGLLVQTKETPMLTKNQLKIVTKRKATDDEINQMLFAFNVTRHVKSNAIVLAKDNATVGIGAGQMSRVDAVKIAISKAGLKSKNSVLSSDAFFPFRDGIDEAAKAGITAIVQPGGSIRDQEVINAANEHKMAMAFTGIRLFWH